MAKKLFDQPILTFVNIKHNDIIVTSNMNVYDETFNNQNEFLAPGRIWDEETNF